MTVFVFRKKNNEESENIEIMKISEQVKPILVDVNEQLVLRHGFPRAKKQMIVQAIDMFNFLGNFQEAVKYIGLFLLDY